MAQIAHDGTLRFALVAALLATTTLRAAEPARWRVLPIRRQAEFEQGLLGGEGEQHMEGGARCRSNPDVIYLGHDVAQMWRSVNGGRSWIKVHGRGLHVRGGHALEVDPVNSRKVFMIASQLWDRFAEDRAGLHVTLDGGDTWKRLLPVPFSKERRHDSRRYTHHIDYDPASIGEEGAKRWYVVFSRHGVYRSEDGGGTWQPGARFGEEDGVYCLHAHPKDGKTVYLGTQAGLRVSHDRGASFEPIGDLPPGAVSSLQINEQAPGALYAVLEGKGLYRSIDSGRTFALLKTFNAIHVFLNPAHPEVLYLVGIEAEDNSLVSHDAGRTWHNVAVIPPVGREADKGVWKRRLCGKHSAVLPDPRDPDKAVAFSRGHFWRTEDRGRTFKNSSTLFTGFAGRPIFDPFNPDRWGLLLHDVGLVLTENGGDWFEGRGIPYAWKLQKEVAHTGMLRGSFQPLRGSAVFVGAAGVTWKLRLVRTEDMGRTWTLAGEKWGHNTFLSFHGKDPNVLYAHDQRSSDAGRTFQPLPGLAEPQASIVGMCSAQPDTVYAMPKSRKALLRSDDRGQTWREVVKVDWRFAPLSSHPVFEVHPENPDLVYTVDTKGDLAVFDGKAWRSLGVLARAGGEDLHNFVEQVAFDPRRPNTLYAGTQAIGLPCIWRSLDDGRTWQDITANHPMCGPQQLVVHPLTGELLSGGLSGTWVFPPPDDGPRTLWRKCADPLEVSERLKTR
ncbi:MAG: hypothetical protein JXR37_23155 [Kiritimatiellae bacterium]|nr:hypothetical protein [Kiritimatiellia bacterium]